MAVAAPRVWAHRAVHLLEDLRALRRAPAGERREDRGTGGVRAGAMAQAVGHDQPQAVAAHFDGPAVAETSTRPDARRPRRRCRRRPPRSGPDAIRPRRRPPCPGRAASRCRTVPTAVERPRARCRRSRWWNVRRSARAPGRRCQARHRSRGLRRRRPRPGQRPDQQLAARGRVLDQIGRQFGRHQPRAMRLLFRSAGARGEIARSRSAPRRPGSARSRATAGARHFHRVMTTFVPFPTVDSISNSFDSRFDPDKPQSQPAPRRVPVPHGQLDVANPRPLILERQPQAPARAVDRRSRSSACPPPPCWTTFRASSLAAVTTFV